jgi:hypothetical protein
MGYNVDYDGEFKLNKPLDKDGIDRLYNYINCSGWEYDVKKCCIKWDSGEKAYTRPMIIMMECIIDVFKTTDYVLNGIVEFYAISCSGSQGTITIVDNKMKVDSFDISYYSVEDLEKLKTEVYKLTTEKRIKKYLLYTPYKKVVSYIGTITNDDKISTHEKRQEEGCKLNNILKNLRVEDILRDYLPDVLSDVVSSLL